MKPRPAVIPTVNRLTMPIESCAPAAPAKIPATTLETSRQRSGLMPAARAASGFSPAARRRMPHVVDERDPDMRKRAQIVGIECAVDVEDDRQEVADQARDEHVQAEPNDDL